MAEFNITIEADSLNDVMIALLEIGKEIKEGNETGVYDDGFAFAEYEEVV